MVIAMSRSFRTLAFCVVSASMVVLRSSAQTPAGQPAKIATEYDWSMRPTEDLGQPGSKTVSLAACPPGVKGNEPEYWVLINGSEPAKVTGGTCAGDGRPGTLQFVSHGTHARGETLPSASSGLQEALIAARFIPTNPTGGSQSGKVIVPPGEYKAFARVSIRAANLTVDFSGSILECWMNDTCIFVGDPSNSNAYEDITLINPRGRPTIPNGQRPLIEVNAQKTRLFNVSTRINAGGGTFGSYVQVDDDEAFLLDGLDTTLGGGAGSFGLRCDATVCNPVIYAPGPFATFPGVGWLKHLNIALQCSGNGIDWQAGNTSRISDSVIEGFAQYGVRAGTKRGGYGGFALDNVYEEVGNCKNPVGRIGQAGVIAQGGTVKIQGGEAPTGWVPRFASTGNTDYRYYIVARHEQLGASNPLYAGRALTNGAGSIVVTTADITGAASFDLLRVTAVAGQRDQGPYGTGNYAVLTKVSRSSACSKGVCTFTDPRPRRSPTRSRFRLTFRSSTSGREIWCWARMGIPAAFYRVPARGWTMPPAASWPSRDQSPLH
jgi:hypothetical protein